MGRSVIVLPLFFATGSACHFGSFCPFPFLSTFSPHFSLPHSLLLSLSARLAIVAGPALSSIPCSHLYTLSLSRPGLSLWQVPPGLLPPSPTSLPLSFSHLLHRYLPLYPLSISFILARLVIVIGPALRLPFFISFPYPHYPHIYYTSHTYISLLLHLFWPGLSLWQVPPTPLSCTFSLFIPLISPSL